MGILWYLALIGIVVIIAFVVRLQVLSSRSADLVRKVLHLDFIEEQQYASSSPWEYEAFLRRKFFEQDSLLRWRIVRALEVLTTTSEWDMGLLTEEGRRIIFDSRTKIEGMAWRQLWFAKKFPFFVVDTLTVMSVEYPFIDSVIRISGLPVDLIEDIAHMAQIKEDIVC